MSAERDLGGWALDALDDVEQAEIDALLDRDPDLARTAGELQRVVAVLSEPLSTPPPVGLRRDVLTAARAAGQPARAAVDPIEVYAAQAGDLADALAAVGPEEWDAPVAAYGWTLERLAAHAVAVERHFLELVTSPDLRVAVDEPDHIALGGGDAPVDPATWAGLAQEVLHALRTLPAEALAREVVFNGLPMRLDTLCVVRGFELWTHADDVRVARGLPVVDPEPGVLRTMSDRAVRGLPSLLLLAGIVPPAAVARVVLTGAGGGTWDVDLDLEAEAGGEAPAPPTTTVVADVVDFCRLVSSRLRPDELDAEVEGDEALARDLLVGAQGIAM